MTESPNAAHQFTATTNSAVAQARLVARDAVAQIDAGTYGCEAWGRSMLTLFDVVARGSATQFKTVTSHACCGTWSTKETCGMGLSDPIFVAADDDFSRRLTIAVAFTQVGGQVSIPNNLIGFEPPVLTAGATSFSLYLRDAQYIGASYRGTVRLTTISSNLAPVVPLDWAVAVEL